MAPDEKSNAMSIFVSHEEAFTVACVKDLSSKIHYVEIPAVQSQQQSPSVGNAKKKVHIYAYTS
jgi:hypothetical protein